MRLGFAALAAIFACAFVTERAEAGTYRLDYHAQGAVGYDGYGLDYNANLPGATIQGSFVFSDPDGDGIVTSADISSITALMSGTGYARAEQEILGHRELYSWQSSACTTGCYKPQNAAVFAIDETLLGRGDASGIQGFARSIFGFHADPRLQPDHYDVLDSTGANYYFSFANGQMNFNFTTSNIEYYNWTGITNVSISTISSAVIATPLPAGSVSLGAGLLLLAGLWRRRARNTIA